MDVFRYHDVHFVPVEVLNNLWEFVSDPATDEAAKWTENGEVVFYRLKMDEYLDDPIGFHGGDFTKFRSILLDGCHFRLVTTTWVPRTLTYEHTFFKPGLKQMVDLILDDNGVLQFGQYVDAGCEDENVDDGHVVQNVEAEDDEVIPAKKKQKTELSGQEENK